MKTSKAKRSTPLAAILISLGLIASACSGESTVNLAADAPELGDDSSQYGLSLEEWSAAQSPAPLQPSPTNPTDDVPAEAAAEAPSAETADRAPTADLAQPAGHSNGVTIDSSGPVSELSIEWEDLIPPGQSGDEIFARYEERLNTIEPGTPEATALYEEFQAEFDPVAVNPELEGKEIRLAGFVAPLTYDGELVVEFLLVPTFGACIHVPAPPPNQTVMVSVEKGLTVEEAWGAIWVEGTMVLESSSTDLADASYRIDNATSGTYGDI